MTEISSGEDWIVICWDGLSNQYLDVCSSCLVSDDMRFIEFEKDTLLDG